MNTLCRLFWDLIIGNGVARATQSKFNKRMAICRTNMCKSYKKPLGVKFLEKCNACGCFLNVKARVDEFYIDCPKGLWKTDKK